MMRACASGSMTCWTSSRRYCCRWRVLTASPAPQPPAGAIIIARDLLPSQLLGFEGGRVAGLCLAQGGATSHASILAAAMGIPALVALGPGILAVPDGAALVLDADHARVEIDPGAERLAQARALLGTRRAREVSEQAAAQQLCYTADGVRIEILANVGSLAEAEAAVRNGAEGCGLLRTEFLFLERQSPPTEAEQTARLQPHRRSTGCPAAHHPHARRRR